MNKRYIVRLTEGERGALGQLASKGKAAARKRTHAQVLLKPDTGEHGPAWTDERIVEAFELGAGTVQSIRKRFVEEGLDAAIERKKQCRLSRQRVLDGKRSEAGRRLLQQGSCRPNPLDASHAGRRVGSTGDCRQHLARDDPPGAKKNGLKPWRYEMWCIPPKQNAEFVCAMENVLEVYQRPYSPEEPVVCMDEAGQATGG